VKTGVRIIAMGRDDEVRKFLKGIQSETGRQIACVVRATPTHIGDVQVNVYPASGDAASRIFNLHDGLTKIKRQTIRDWFEQFLL
jgi:hypothetical protein